MSHQNLPDAEMEVLACLHRHGEATARQVRETMKSYRPMAHGSVATLLKRLEAKSMVTRKKADTGKAFVYVPTEHRGRTFRGLVKDMLQRIFHGDGVALVASLFETKPPTPKELEKIQQLLNHLRKKNAGEGGRAK